MFLRNAQSLWLRLALPLFLFVVAGSTVLAVWMQISASRESRHVFATLARTNADLVRSARLPASERAAEYLGRVLNMHVFFRRPVAGGEGVALTPHPGEKFAAWQGVLASLQPDGGIVKVDADAEAIAATIESDLVLVLVRAAEPAWSVLLRGETLLVLAIFWLVSVALAWALARGLVRPLRLLTARLPQIDRDPDATLPGAERADEIGQLARAYLAARSLLADERKRRAESERLALLGRMATGLAHEIRNPLAAIRMHSQLIESAPGPELAAAARESLPVVLGETAKIEGLVQQWMFLARPEPPQTSPAEWREITASVVRTIEPQAAHAGVKIVCEVPDGLRVNVDARRLSQAMGNVVINAIHAMPRGGTLTITGYRGDSARLVFRDTGPGFSPQALARHAELFYSEKEGGMGIGLSVASEILKAHGGALVVANAPDGGAVVKLILPLVGERKGPRGERGAESIPRESSSLAVESLVALSSSDSPAATPEPIADEPGAAAEIPANEIPAPVPEQQTSDLDLAPATSDARSPHP